MAKTKQNLKVATKVASKPKVRIIPLGGVDGIGKNITVFEYGNDLIIVDCGLSFPEDNMLGIDLVIPDTAYLEANASRIRGLVLTHGHEDHIGAIPYLLKKLSIPIYGTRLTLGILEGKLTEHNLLEKAYLNVINPGESIELGVFKIEFILVNHSIPDSVALCIETPCGRIIHTGDFKMDFTPVLGAPINLGRFAELGNKGVRLLLADSTNVEREGYTPTERIVTPSFDKYFMQHDKRVLVATFSSNVHRIQQIINAAVKHDRKLVITGRSMLNIIKAATKLNYITIPAEQVIDVSDMRKYPPGKIALITTGSQGEPMSALYRMAFGEHSQISVGKNDLVILSSSAIPGNEKLINNIVNELCKRGVEVINGDRDIHVSGHACKEELKIIHSLVKPECFIPVHGEYKHLKKHAELALELGMQPKNIMIPETGRVIELGKKTLALGEEVPSGQVLVDGYGVGDVGSTVLRDRQHLAEDGVIVISAMIDTYANALVYGPEITTRGFIYAPESKQLIEEIRKMTERSIERCLKKGLTDLEAIKLRVRDELQSVVNQKTKRRPMILTLLMELSI
ncbi:ribonuclease J [Eubacteriales bacterium OttesenSCG-928-G02]|nr:ribonuclease J [Eubacteriales bacterium OttesenSCG-928-G02]